MKKMSRWAQDRERGVDGTNMERVASWKMVRLHKIEMH
jgi:hypothetical protein